MSSNTPLGFVYNSHHVHHVKKRFLVHQRGPCSLSLDGPVCLKQHVCSCWTHRTAFMQSCVQINGCDSFHSRQLQQATIDAILHMPGVTFNYCLHYNAVCMWGMGLQTGRMRCKCKYTSISTASATEVQRRGEGTLQVACCMQHMTHMH